jgi:hypothetical protein
MVAPGAANRPTGKSPPPVSRRTAAALCDALRRSGRRDGRPWGLQEHTELLACGLPVAHVRLVALGSLTTRGPHPAPGATTSP